MARLTLLTLFFTALLFGGSACAADEADHVVVVVNGDDPDSRRIGEYYLRQRGIPEGNLVELATSTRETVSFQEYVETIHNPLLAKLLEKDFISGAKAGEPDAFGRDRMSVAVSSIAYLVTVRGIPLRFDNVPGEEANAPARLPKQFQVTRGSVDSELALLAASPSTGLAGFVENPLFGNPRASGAEASRTIRVSRLDGPSAAQVTRLIDRSLEAEAEGLAGRAYFDIGGPHEKGDIWLNEAGGLAKQAFFETDFETTKRPMDLRDRFDAPAIYMGWYRPHAYGPWRQPRWAVPPGAIAYHLHSFSATTVRSETRAWLGPLVAQGYTATFGYVYEPYLELTHRPQVFLAILMNGGTFGEAIAGSTPVLSWQGVAIGDPLYRPFATGLDEQLAKAREGPYAAYPILREIRRLQAEKGASAALDYARRQFVEYPSLALAYRLARLYEDAGETQKGVEALKIIRYIGSFGTDEFVLAQKIADFLDAHDESAIAFRVYERLLGERNLNKALRLSLLETGAKVAENAGRSTEASRWPLEARQLKAPPGASN